MPGSHPPKDPTEEPLIPLKHTQGIDPSPFPYGHQIGALTNDGRSQDVPTHLLLAATGAHPLHPHRLDGHGGGLCASHIQGFELGARVTS